MSTWSMWATESEQDVKAFLGQLEADYDFVKDLMHYYNFKIIACGRHVRAKSVYYPYILPPGMTEKDEFLEFIDDNGFKVVPFSSPGIFRIYPQYKENAK